VKTVKKGERVTGAARVRLTTQVCKRYEEGAVIRDLAEELGRSYGFVHGVLTDAGVVLRSRGGSGSRKKPASRGTGT
jgi:hypothetical protein